MEDQVYIVTLYKREDLEQFYTDMDDYPMVMLRPLSRNTLYRLTATQAEDIRQDSRVWGVELVDDLQIRSQVYNNEPYNKSGFFWKDDTEGQATVDANDFQWGHIHCAGNQGQRGKGSFGPKSNGWSYERTNSDVEIFNSGRHVDVVIVDDPVSYDSEEWYSPSSNQTRFVQYQWFNELNSLVNSIDDDNQTEPTGTITYHTNDSIPYFHGNHVCGTVAGQHYGWAREATIYNLAVTGSWASGQSIPAYLIFDYLRAFHRSKPVNSTTGVKNPTVTNHSYGGIIYMPNENPLNFGDVTSISYQGVTYNAGNPGPSGWTAAGVSTDFGVRVGGQYDVYPSYSAGIAADVQDCIEDGIVVIGAAGNDNLLIADVDDDNWDNFMTVNGVGSFYYNRGAWPNSPDTGAINVGALSKQGDFRRSTYTQFGPGVTVFAPGDNIISAFDSNGINDSKYSEGSGNYYYPIQGTSMASPQVCGIIACLSSGKERINNEFALAYLDRFSIVGDMTFDINGGSYSDNTCRQGSPNKYLHIENPRSVVGFVDSTIGRRKEGMSFPRRRVYFTSA